MIDGMNMERGISVEADNSISPTVTQAAIIENTSDIGKVPSYFRQTVGALADAWFDPKSFEQDPKLYEKLGVKKFKKYMPTTGDLVSRLVWKKYFGMPSMVGNGGEQGLRDGEFATRIYESIHLGLFGICTALMVEDFQAGRLDHVAFGAGINSLLNVYPIMVQRYNRSRLQNVMQRIHDRAQKENK